MPNRRAAPPPEPVQPDLAKLAAAPLANPCAPFLPLGRRRRRAVPKAERPEPPPLLPFADLPKGPKEGRRVREYRRLAHDRAGLLDHFAGTDRPIEVIARHCGMTVADVTAELAKREAAANRPEVREMRAFIAGQTARSLGKSSAAPRGLGPEEAARWREGYAHGIEEVPLA